MTGQGMEAAQDVNNTDAGHCSTCGQDKDMNFTIQCEDCKNWIHYTCSALPLYLLLCLARTKRKYTCEKCSFDKYADSEWTAKASEAIDRMKKEQTTLSPPDTTETDHRGTQTPPPTPPGPSDLTQETTREEGERDTDGTEVPAASSSDNRVTETTPVAQTEQPKSDPPPQPPTTPTDTSRNKETPICRYYRKGACRYGSAGKECKFRHPRVCRKLVNHGNRGELGCKQGKKCDMFHPTVCRNSQRNRVCLVESCRFLHVKGTRRNTEETNSSTPRKDTTPPPRTASNPRPDPQNEENFLWGMRQDMASLLKTMEAHTMLLSNILKENRTGWAPQMPPKQMPPWFDVMNSH